LTDEEGEEEGDDNGDEDVPGKGGIANKGGIDNN
jgi:hypothetical protein